uniref:Uncharacterized protein n=1 Tax=Anopheles atroparvus TaxID=41427 RepID=A0A182J5I4_ANOAO
MLTENIPPAPRPDAIAISHSSKNHLPDGVTWEWELCPVKLRCSARQAPAFPFYRFFCLSVCRKRRPLGLGTGLRTRTITPMSISLQEEFEIDAELGRQRLLPEPVRLFHRLGGKRGILCLAVERKLVLRLAVRDLVDLEPLDRSLQQTGKHRLDVVNIVHLVGDRIVYADGDNLPVRFTLVDERNGAEDFHLQHLAPLGYPRANLQYIDRIVVALATGIRVENVGSNEHLFQPNTETIQYGQSLLHSQLSGQDGHRMSILGHFSR